MAQQYLPYITLQPDYPLVFADVSQSLVELDKVWISAYCSNVPAGSRHGKLLLSASKDARGGVSVELDDENNAGLNVERADESLMDLVVSTPGGSRTSYEASETLPNFELAPTRLRVARRTLGPDLVKGALGVTALDVHEGRYVVGGSDGQAFTSSLVEGEESEPMELDASSNIEEVAAQRMRLRQRSAKVALKGHLGDVRSAKFLAGGQVVLTTSSDMTARLYDVSSGACPRVFKGHRRAVVCSSIIHRGHNVLTGSLDGTVRLWDVSSEGAAIQTITAEKFAGVNAMARDEGGSIYMGLTSGSMQVVRDGQTVEVIPGQAGGITALDMNGIDIITGTSDGDMRLYDARSLPSPVTSWKRNGASVTDIKLAHDAAIVSTDDGMPYRVRLNGDLAVTHEYVGWEVDHVDKVSLDQKGRVWIAGAQGAIRLYH